MGITAFWFLYLVYHNKQYCQLYRRKIILFLQRPYFFILLGNRKATAGSVTAFLYGGG